MEVHISTVLRIEKANHLTAQIKLRFLVANVVIGSCKIKVASILNEKLKRHL